MVKYSVQFEHSLSIFVYNEEMLKLIKMQIKNK